VVSQKPGKAGMSTLENDIIAKIKPLARSAPGARHLQLGIGDDAALFACKAGNQSVLTCDWFLEGIHFLRDNHPPDSIGWKCLTRALSDIAAMGGQPRCFLLSLAIPKKLTGGWLSAFLRGLRRAAVRFSCPLAGGDTTRRDEILINVTAIGEVRNGQAVLRSGARAGDAIFVTGTLGEAELGLHLLKSSRDPKQGNSPAFRKHLYPEPRLALGHWLSTRRLASAMMDLSDGLSGDLPRLCSASRVGARIEAANIPAVRLPPQSKSNPFDSLSLALNGGDDYELLFTVRPRDIRHMPRFFKGIALTRIGQITAGRRLKLAGRDGREETLLGRGWDPFRQSP
jgi:thiamine-monophosphate kinase